MKVKDLKKLGITIDNGIAESEILDAEGDPLEIVFNNADDVEINTKNYTHITLQYSDLFNLILMIEAAQEYYKSENQKPK